VSFCQITPAPAARSRRSVFGLRQPEQVGQSLHASHLHDGAHWQTSDRYRAAFQSDQARR